MEERIGTIRAGPLEEPRYHGRIVYLLFDYCSIDAFHGHLKCSGGIINLILGA